MIVVTGGAGFIGSVLINRLNQTGRDNIIVVDELLSEEKWRNLNGLNFTDIYHKIDFYNMVVEDKVPFNIDSIIHLGACSNTTEKDADYLVQNNYRYSVELVKHCLPRRARFIYASSAATYGDGSLGYIDDENKLPELRPMNMYGYSKHIFDLWVKKQKIMNKIVGLKYFNVYGPNEYHKGEMRSVVHKAFEQIHEKGKVRLFKSYKKEYKDGEQKRDFIYVNDAVEITTFYLDNRDKCGLFNVGTGEARTWNDLVTAIFNALGKPINIEYIDMPEQIRNSYQYFTEANMDKLKSAGYGKKFTSIENGVDDYVNNYLLKNKYIAL